MAGPSLCVRSAVVYPDVPAWSAIFALTLCTSTLIASEFMPVSLLTPIASDLQLTEGRVGLVIAVSGLFAVITSLSISALSKGLDRRHLLLGLALGMLASGVIATFAPTFEVLLLGRALLGMVIGGFWSMSAAVVMQLVPEKEVTKGLSFLNGGNAFSMTVGAPLGSYLGQYIGWRGAFFTLVPLAVVVLIWLSISLPSMPVRAKAASSNVFGVLRRPSMRMGLLGVTLMFMGQFGLFTYLRPFMEHVTQLSVSLLSLYLLAMGGAGLIGTMVIGRANTRNLRATLIAAPLAMGVIALLLILFGGLAVPAAVLLVLWGFVATAAPVAWWAWLSRAHAEDAEAGGGLMVAFIQLAITVGSALGGVLFDSHGYQSTFGMAAVLLIGASLVALVVPTRKPAEAILPEANPSAE